MTFWNNINLQIGNSPYINNISSINFKRNNGANYSVTDPINDTFKSESDKYFLDKTQIESLVKSSPRITELLKEYKIPLKINMDELAKLRNGHLKSTKYIVSKMLSNLPEDMKKEINYSDLILAAELHDYGKVLIPKQILNKKSALNDKEKEIMELHSEFGYELLKQQGINDNVLNLIKYHHQNPNGNGYPKIDENFKYNTGLQILSLADEYSALTEQRSYKPALEKEQALDIIESEKDIKNFSPEIINALKKSF